MNPVESHNYNLFLKLTGNEALTVDQEGRLKQVEDAAKKGLAESTPKIQNVAFKALTERVREFSPKKNLETGYLTLAARFFNGHLIDEGQFDTLKDTWYKLRREVLMKLYDGNPVLTEVHLAEEMFAVTTTPEEEREMLTPDLNETGVNGSYWLPNLNGDLVGLFKPREQEFGMPLNPKEYTQSTSPLKPGHIAGTSWLREIAAFQVDSECGNMVGVPNTYAMTMNFPGGKGFVEQTGSFQYRVPNAENGTGLSDKEILAIPDFEIQKMALFDMLIVNSDRTPGNFLIKQDHTVVPIDHGLCFQNVIYILGSWVKFPQITKPIIGRLKEWILNFNIEKSCKILKSLGIEEQAIFNHRVMHAFLVFYVKAGKTIADMAKMCARPVDGQCAIEILLDKAKSALEQGNKQDVKMNDSLIIAKFVELLGAS